MHLFIIICQLGHLVKLDIYVHVVVFIIITFDLWMNKGAFDTFALLINFLTLDWEPNHVTIGIVEEKNMIINF